MYWITKPENLDELHRCSVDVFRRARQPLPGVGLRRVRRFFTSQSLALLPVFLYFTLLRGLSAWGLFHERVWGFGTAVVVCATTVLWVPFLMPFAGFEMLFDGAILFLLLWARFGETLLFGADGDRAAA